LNHVDDTAFSVVAAVVVAVAVVVVVGIRLDEHILMSLNRHKLRDLLLIKNLNVSNKNLTSFYINMFVTAFICNRGSLIGSLWDRRKVTTLSV